MGAGTAPSAGSSHRPTYWASTSWTRSAHGVRAVALNLAISLITVISSLLIRFGALSLAPVISLLPVVIAMIVGAVSAAYAGTAFVHRISEHLLERIILVFLVVIGTALIVEAFLPEQVAGLLPEVPVVRIIAGVLFGLLVW